MEEIYWITRLDAVCDWLTGLQVAGIAFGVICLMTYLIWKYAAVVSYHLDSDDFKEHKSLFTRFKWIGSIVLVFGLLCGLGRSFVPTTKEACAIYVGGSVVDYVQGNDTIKALPDKVVNFANDYLNQLIEKNKPNNNNNFNNNGSQNYNN